MMYEILLTVAFAITSILALPAATDGPIPGIFAKTFLPDCAIEGRFSDNPTSKPFGPQGVPTILACQTQCHFTGGCVMYSWDVAANICYLYAANGSLDVAGTVFTDEVVRGSTGVFFADRTLRDGSEVCYYTTPVSH